MPMNSAIYASNFKQRALECKEAAGWRCSDCGKPCRVPKEGLQEFYDRVALEYVLSHSLYHLKEEIFRYPQRWTLTARHHNHDPENPDAVLVASCAPCHLRYDAKMHAENAAKTRERKRIEVKGQIPLEVTP